MAVGDIFGVALLELLPPPRDRHRAVHQPTAWRGAHLALLEGKRRRARRHLLRRQSRRGWDELRRRSRRSGDGRLLVGCLRWSEAGGRRHRLRVLSGLCGDGWRRSGRRRGAYKRTVGHRRGEGEGAVDEMPSAGGARACRERRRWRRHAERPRRRRRHGEPPGWRSGQGGRWRGSGRRRRGHLHCGGRS